MENYNSEANFSPAFDYYLSGEEAFFGILYVTITADGKVCKEEIDKIWTIVDNMMLFSGIPESRWSSIVETMSRLLEKEGHQILTQLSARYLPVTLRETAYTIAVDLLFSDGVVNYHEKIFMEELRNLLGINRNYAEQVVEVMALRYLNI